MVEITINLELMRELNAPQSDIRTLEKYWCSVQAFQRKEV